MSEQETIEIDPDKLSQDVVDELVQKDIMDEEQAEDIGDEVWLDEVADRNPEKVSFLDYIKSLYSWSIDLVTKFGVGLKNKFISSGKGTGNYISNKINILKKRTIFAEVTSVEPKQKRNSSDFFGKKEPNANKVVMKLNHDETDEFEIEFESDSKELSNIMEYKSVGNPKKLEGEKLMLSRGSFDKYNSTGILVPHNVSKSGSIRFKLYSLSREVFKKSRVKGIYQGPIDDLLFAYVITGIMAFFLYVSSSGFIFSLLGMIPLILWCFVFGFHAIHFFFSIINGIICVILKSDYKKIEKQG